MRPLAAAVAVAMLGTVGVGLVMAAAGGLIPWQDPRFADYDHHAYLAIAGDGPGAPGKASTPPFCWRILTPLAAAALPLSPPRAFFVLSVASVAGCALLFRTLHRRAGMTERWSLYAQGVYFSCFWAAGFSIWNYMMVDTTSLLIIVAGLVILESGSAGSAWHGALLAALMAAGALNKESVLALAAAVVVHRWVSDTGRGAARLARAVWPALPALLVLATLRWAITADAAQMREFSGYSLPSVFLEMAAKRLAELPRWGIEALVDPWGPLILIPILAAPRASLRWLRDHPHRTALLAAAFAQTLFATSVGRLVMVGLPVVCLLVVERVRDAAATRSAGMSWAIWLLALQFVFQYARRTTLGLGIPPYEPHAWVTAAYILRGMAVGAFLAVWIAAPGREPSWREAAR